MRTTTLFIEAPPEFVSPSERADWIYNLLMSEYEPGYLVLDILIKRGIKLAIATGVGRLDESFAQVISILNTVKVPVTLWLTLSDELGYWTNASNTKETFNRVAEIVSWMNAYDLKIERIGFDLEWPVQIATAQQSGNWLEFFRLFKEYKNKFHPKAQENFEKILRSLKALGIEYEFYSFPPIMHKLSATGLTIPKGSRVIEMDYSSFSPRFIAQWIIKKTRDFNTIPAIGIVNGIEGETPGRMLSKRLPYHLTAEDIRMDVEAIGDSDEIYVFALNSASALRKILFGLC